MPSCNNYHFIKLQTQDEMRKGLLFFLLSIFYLILIFDSLTFMDIHENQIVSVPYIFVIHLLLLT
jgi:hypothetical protein